MKEECEAYFLESQCLHQQCSESTQDLENEIKASEREILQLFRQEESSQKEAKSKKTTTPE